MQKMLHRSFKPAKCKTALRLAIPRIKLMKNKKEAHMKQLKRELAQLLDSGQDQTARIRVEHVVREEKTVAAYNLLEIYCELIVARMPIIESQKNCPIDLKEAISSVVYASARCEDIPELKDVCKNFTAKYGKEFTSAALELRPNCGVGRMLIEKFSVNAPDGPTKVKILTAIAEEHNIKWDPASFGAKESKIYDDMLNVPNSSTEATKISAHPPIIQVPPSHYEQRPPSVQVPNYSVQDPKHLDKNDEPTSFSEYSSRSSPNPENSGYSNTKVNIPMSSGTYSPNSRPLGTGNQAFRNSYSGNESAYSSPRQHWNMDFKDATTAARAAAESAELASIAARAAAELSSRGNLTQQYSMESPMSLLHRTRDAEPKKYTDSASQNEHLGRDPVNIYLHGRSSRNYEKVDSKEQHAWVGDTKNVCSNTERSGDKSTHGSLKSTASSFDEEPSADNQSTDAYSQRNSSQGRQMEDFAEVSVKRNSSENVDPHNVRVRGQSNYAYSHSESNTSNDRDALSNLNWKKSENDKRNSGRSPFVNELHDTKNSDFSDYQEVWIRKQSSHSSSHSASSTFSDDHDIGPDSNRQKSGISSGEDSFLRKDRGSLQSSTKETTDSFNNASAVFDDYESDNHDSEDNFDLEKEHAVHGFSTNFSSPGQSSTTRPSTRTNSWSNDQIVESRGKSISQSHIFSEQRDTPVFFQTSTSSAVPSHGVDLLATFDDYDPSSESEEEMEKSKFVRSTNPSIGRNEKNMDSHQAEDSIFNPQLIEVTEDTEHSNDSSLEERSMELNFGNLRGGLRHKGFRRPPYSSSPRGNALSSVEATNDASTSIKESSPTAAVEASVSSVSYHPELFSRTGSDEVNRKLSMRASSTRVDSSDDSEEEQPKQTFSSTQNQYEKTPSVEENKRSSLRVPVPYFGSGNDDSDEDLPKTSLKFPSNTVFSRRTKASPSNSQRSSNLKATVSSETTVVSDYGREKNSFIRSSNADESLPKTQPKEKNSDHLENFQHPQQANNSFSRSSNANELPKTQPQKNNSDHLGSFQYPQLAKNSFSRSSNANESLSKTQPQKKNSDHFESFQHPQLAKTSFSRSSNADEHVPKTQPQKKNSDHFESFQHPQLAKTSFSRNANESLPKTQPQKKNSDHLGSFQHPLLSSQAKSRLVPETKRSSSDRTIKLSETEQPYTSVSKTISSASAKSLKAQSSIGEGQSKEKASHVHPKLPDIDILTAHLNSLRQNRK